MNGTRRTPTCDQIGAVFVNVEDVKEKQTNDEPQGDAMNHEQWAECEWDGCQLMVHEESEGEPLCWIHYPEQLAEEQAETANKMAKEDF